MKRHKLSLALSLVVVFIVLGCSSRKSSYFPMKEGLVLRYRLTTHNLRTSDWPDNAIMEHTFLPVREIDGVKVVPRRAAFGTSGRSDIQFLHEDKDGIYIFAGQTAYDTEPRRRSTPEYFIRYPIQAGTGWQTNTKFFGPEITLNSKIEKIDDVITVPAGTYKGCMKIIQTGSLNNRPVEIVNWYATDVGLVRSVTKFWKSYGVFEPVLVEIGMQLEDFKK